MSRWIMSFAVPCMVLALSVALHADDAATPAAAQKPAEMPAETSAEASQQRREIRITQPWRKLTSLSAEQRSQIAEIHKTAIAEIKAIETREREDIMALLSEEQKTELKALLDSEAAERKLRAAERKKAAEHPVEPAPVAAPASEGT
jgi:Spy/CpxP family protein refolding chaperone